MRGLSEIGLDDNLVCREVVDVEFLFTASDIPGVGSELLWCEPARIARRQIIPAAPLTNSWGFPLARIF